MAVPNKLLSVFGRLYELTGRKRCQNCGGPLEAGESCWIEITQDDIETAATEVQIRLELCETCVRAHTLQQEADTVLAKKLKTSALESVL